MIFAYMWHGSGRAVELLQDGTASTSGWSNGTDAGISFHFVPSSSLIAFYLLDSVPQLYVIRVIPRGVTPRRATPPRIYGKFGVCQLL